MTAREEFEKWWPSIWGEAGESDFIIFQAGRLVGREAMREETAALCDSEYRDWSKANHGLMAAAAYQCALKIKELP